jgi:urease accessory protein UreE
VGRLPVFRERPERVGTRILEVTIPWQEAAHGRTRLRAPDGEELSIELQNGSRIRDGDVFGPSPGGIFYRALVEPRSGSR